MCDWPGNTGSAPYALSLGQAATPQTHTHKYTHAQTYMHTYHTQAKTVVENLQTIKEMAILSSHNKEDKALKMVS